jgi:hypothetical protein
MTVTAFIVVRLSQKSCLSAVVVFQKLMAVGFLDFCAKHAQEKCAANLLDFCANFLLYDLLRIRTVRPSTRCTFSSNSVSTFSLLLLFKRYPTRSSSQELFCPFPEPKQVYRRRVNRLPPRRLHLENLGDEALPDIQYLFPNLNQPTVSNSTQNPNLAMGSFLTPLNFAAIQGYPHQIPEKAIDKLPVFQGDNATSAKSHISKFEMCLTKFCRGHTEEDVKMTLFVYSLEGDALDWFTDFPADTFSTLEEILDEFRKRWGDQKEHRFQLGALTTIKKKENETMIEFNTKFNNLVKGCHKDIKPPDAAILIYYTQAFEGEIRYALVDKEPQDLITAQKITVRVEQNLLESRKSNIPGFTRGPSPKVNDEKKKEPKDQGSSSDGVDKLAQLIKQMEINQANQAKEHANQMNDIQNRLIAMERNQGNRPPPRQNDRWPRRPPHNEQKPLQIEQRPPNPFESTNLVEHQSIPYCRPCGEFHEESNCAVFLEDCYNDYGDEQVNMCGKNYYGEGYDWMNDCDLGSHGNFMSGEVDRATEKYGPKPTPQQIAEMAKHKGYTYQRGGNKDKGQTSAPKVPPTFPKSSAPMNMDLNIDLGGWLNNAKILVSVSEIMKIPSQREKLLKAVHEPPKTVIQKQPATAYQDAPVILQNWDRSNSKNLPFYLSLLVNDKVLHNCMLDSGASSNVMTKKGNGTVKLEDI